MPNSMPWPACMVTASTIEDRQRTEPTDRSIPPVIMTNVMPSAMMAVKVMLRVMLKRLVRVAKESVAKVRNRQARTTASTTQKVWLPKSRDQKVCCLCAIVWSSVTDMVGPCDWC